MLQNRCFLGSKKSEHTRVAGSRGWAAGSSPPSSRCGRPMSIFIPPKVDVGKDKEDVTASHGGVSVGGIVTNSTINTNPATGGDAQPQGY